MFPSATLLGSSLSQFHKLPDVFEYFLLYSIKLYIGNTTSTSSALLITLLLILEMKEINGALFLKANFLL